MRHNIDSTLPSDSKLSQVVTLTVLILRNISYVCQLSLAISSWVNEIANK